MKLLLSGALALSLLTGLTTVGQAAEPGEGAAPYRVPFNLSRGKSTFDKSCAECHGAWADGTDKGPPLIHRFYEPGHHSDIAFQRAITQGVKQHHWNFGDMKPVEGMTRKKMDSLVPYVRYYQQQKKLY